MLKLYITLQFVIATQIQNAFETLSAARRQHGRDADKSERGSITLEQITWAVVILAILGGVAAAIRAYVNKQKGQLH